MEHISNTQLNEYLDKALDAAQTQRVEAHLATCAACQAELAELQALFTELAALTEIAFAGDVAEAVVSELAQETPLSRWSIGILALQAAIGVGLMVVLWPSVQWLLRLVGESAETAVITLQPQPRLFWQDTITGVAIALEELQMGWQLDIPFEQWSWVLALALVIWLVGNRLLFIDSPQNNQMRN
ncbi:MAG: zf-HC2 domain-containing protein [Chloroflexota bacterium]